MKKEEYVANRLHMFRKKRIGTITAAAKKVNVTRAEWRSWELGHSEPAWFQWPLVLKALRVTHRMFWEEWKEGKANSVSVFWDGKTYPSIRAAAEAVNITEQAMRYRLSQGYTNSSQLQKIYRRKK